MINELQELQRKITAQVSVRTKLEEGQKQLQKKESTRDRKLEKERDQLLGLLGNRRQSTFPTSFPLSTTLTAIWQPHDK